MRKLTLLFALLCPLLSFSQWNQKIKAVDAALTTLHEQQLFNGTVLIAEKGKVLYRKAFGIAGTTQQPLTTSSAFNLASVSKQFFAMMVMQLKERGLLQYDDAVQKHLPQFPYPNITLRQLLNHVSGLPEYFDVADRYRSLLDTLTNASMLALLAEKKPALVFTPGERFQYCNSNYTTLASVIEKLSGLSCDSFFAKNIAQPLRLKNTYIYNIRMKSFPASRVFGFHYTGGKAVPDDLVWLDGIVGDGNVYSSVDDLYTWDQALYTDKLVKQSTFSEAITPPKLNDGSSSSYGFGWFIEKQDSEVAHTGGWVGFRTFIDRFIGRQQTLIVLDNSGNNWAMRIAKSVLLGKPYTMPHTELISNVQLIDGTGTSSIKTAVRIVDNRIADVGALKALPNEPVTDGKGFVLAPGFIDSHSHHERGLEKDPSCMAAISQGITSIVIGQDGGSDPVDSVRAFLQRHPVSVNIATYTGHASLREQVMKNDLLRSATATEIMAMQDLLKKDIAKGSLGLSTGLEYEEGFFSNRDEVLALAKTTAAAGGRYISHIRSEDINLESSIDEIIGIGREAKLPVQISHFKIAMRSKWGQSASLLAKLQAARAEGINITADVYPYTMWSSTPRVLFPKKDFTNEASAEYAVAELFDPGASVMTSFPANKSYEGKTVTEIGTMHNESPAKALMRIVREAGDKGAAIAGASMLDADVANFMQWNNTNICSDGADGGHPRGYGAFTRVLGRYVRDQKIIPLETAIYKMTGLTAEHLGIHDRGIIAATYFADMVLFDPSVVVDNATMTSPKALSSGIMMVWVNGKIVYQNNSATNQFPGTFIGRQ